MLNKPFVDELLSLSISLFIEFFNYLSTDYLSINSELFFLALNSTIRLGRLPVETVVVAKVFLTRISVVLLFSVLRRQVLKITFCHENVNKTTPCCW